MPVASATTRIRWLERIYNSREMILPLAAGADGGLHLTKDGGQSWALVLDMETRITSEAFFPGLPGQLTVETTKPLGTGDRPGSKVMTCGSLRLSRAINAVPYESPSPSACAPCTDWR